MSRREITKKEYSILRQVFTMHEQQLLNVLRKTLENYYEKKNIIATNDYIYVVGDIPIALLAHLDTVHKAPPTEFFHDKERGYLWTPEGLGADDRAGVFGILMLLKAGYRPSILFLTQEERGGIGAEKLIKEWPAPASEINFLIELDRRGEDDAVYYDCGNEEFEKFISSFGFNTEWGSFSDISVIAPVWDRAAVNLSIGYFDEHTLCERLNYRYMFKTIDRVKQILENYQHDKVYDFQAIDWGTAAWTHYPNDIIYYPRTKNGNTLCDCCDTWVPDDSITYVQDDETDDIFRLCPECVAKHVTFCKQCGRATLDIYHKMTDGICKKCKKERKIDVKA